MGGGGGYESTAAWRDRLSIFFLLSSSLPSTSNTQTQPSCHDDPIRAACFLMLQSTQNPPPCCDLTAIAVPSQVAAFLREPFQIKAFSQKTLKSRCRQALNKRTHFLPVSSPALRCSLRGSSASRCSSACCDVRGGDIELQL